MNIVKIKLEGFSGPLDLLPPLIRKGEIEASKVSLSDIIDQLIAYFKETEDPFETGMESISPLSNLLYLKSLSLLPKQSHEIPDDAPLEQELNLALLEKLVEYCRFKEAAATLSIREEREKISFSRPSIETPAQKKPFGIEHLSLSDFSSLFQEVLKKAKSNMGTIIEEKWKVESKISWLKKELTNCNKIDFLLLFSSNKTREELIVLFLAVLELMKLGDLTIIKSGEKILITDGS